MHNKTCEDACWAMHLQMSSLPSPSKISTITEPVLDCSREVPESLSSHSFPSVEPCAFRMGKSRILEETCKCNAPNT